MGMARGDIDHEHIYPHHYGIVNGYGSDGDQRGHHGGALLLETAFERRASDVALHYEGTGNENSLNHYNVLRFEDATLV